MNRPSAYVLSVLLLGCAATVVLAGVEKRVEKETPMSEEKAPLLLLYRTFDGEAAGATQVTVEDDGAWEIGAYGFLKSPKRGAMTSASFREFQRFFDSWRRDVEANGWVEPVHGGCTNPLDMGAVRWGPGAGEAAHYRVAVMDGERRPKEFQRLYDALGKAIPELSVIVPFDTDTRFRKKQGDL